MQSCMHRKSLMNLILDIHVYYIIMKYNIKTPVNIFQINRLSISINVDHETKFNLGRDCLNYDH